ncbi:UNVERIFIED_CONTAM: hypothetical protein Scaly_2938500 [Sesamum calycinum]|uniref:Uncharacterized protein n=1 Tax=Sesamum calycinum TaxID=2727403 RepID=A0AAW2KWK4_9LAMI
MAHMCGFRDVNKACHKDLNPLSRIYLLVDSTSSRELLSLMDASQGYHQIMLNPNDSKRIDNHIGDLAEIFRIQRKNNMKLNLAKYTFGVRKDVGDQGSYPLVERSLPFFKVLRKTKDFSWDKTLARFLKLEGLPGQATLAHLTITR